MRGKLVPATWTHDPADDYVPAKHRRACRYETFVPDLVDGWNPQLSGELAGIVSDAERAVVALGGERLPALDALARLLLRTEAIASSKIEGMQVGVRELARAEARHDLGSKVGNEARAILAGIDAMQLALDGERPGKWMPGVERLLEIHELLTRDAAPWTTPGHVRVVQNWIGGNDFNPCGADFVPPPPEHVPDLLADLLSACDDESLPVLVQAAILHAQFETIHPFNDGNGRVGRALIHVLLRRRGLAVHFVPPVSVVLANQRDRYIDALSQFRAGDPSVWIELFATSVAQSVVLVRRYLEGIDQLRAVWRSALESRSNVPRADSAAWVLIDQLAGHPVLTGPAAVASTGRSKPAVNQAIELLVGAGVLEPLSSGSRNRSWEPRGLLDLIEAVERGS